MSLIHRRKSIIFNNPETTAEKLKIQEIINRHKNNLSISKCTKQRSKLPSTEKLSLKQAINLQGLYQQTNKITALKRFTLQAILERFDKNTSEGIIENQVELDNEKMNMFRSGVNYRSSQRARGSGTKPVSNDDLFQYFTCKDEEKYFQKTKNSTISSNTIATSSFLNKKRITSSNSLVSKNRLISLNVNR